MRLFGLVLLLLSSFQGRALESYFASPVAQGSIDVVFHANGSVQNNVPVVASFGMPFPRGSVTRTGTNNGINRIRVMDGQTELPAFVAELSPWRHRTNGSIDNQSSRMVLIQVELTFSNINQPKTLRVEWGGVPRTVNRGVRVARDTTWRQVSSGSFVAADNVFEPKVLVQLPPSWLSKGVLRPTQALAFDASNLPSRDDPVVMSAIETWPGTQEAERAMKNFFYTIINEDDPLVTDARDIVPYKTVAEPWLYDRAATMFALYFRSGSIKALREAFRHTDFYRAHLSAGDFNLPSSDNKYDFNESLAYAYWLSGDETFLPAISQTATRHDDSAHQWSTTLSSWTERRVAFKLEAHAIDYEVTGNLARRDSVNNIISALRDHQNGVGLPIPPAQRVDGGWYHTGNQHDASEMPGNEYGASLWMTALLTDALRRAYSTGEDTDTAHMIRRSGQFLKSGLRSEMGQYSGLEQTLAPRYIVRPDGSDFPGGIRVVPPIHDEEHALDVTAAMAWADYFGELLQNRDTSLAAFVDQVYHTHDLGVNFWTRPDAPALAGRSAYRVSPARKWAWQYGTSDGLSWALQGAAPEMSLFQNGFE